MKCVVGGGGGFIAGHMVRALLERGHEVTAVDIKPFGEWWQRHPDATNCVMDLSDSEAAHDACDGQDWILNFAARMGGMGMIQTQQVETGLNVLISTNMVHAASNANVSRYLFASSACVYPEYRQETTEGVPLKESDAWPAQPQDQYGLEKLFGEELALRFQSQRGLSVRLPRFHAIYGPHGTWEGGAEKAPAAICRKVIQAKLSGVHEIEIWGDGNQVRSFCYIDDAVEGILRLMESDYCKPINIGYSGLVTINQLVDIAEEIAGVRLDRKYNLSAPQGVRGRNSDNTLIKATLGWEPSIPLRDGLAKTYEWIHDQIVTR